MLIVCQVKLPLQIRKQRYCDNISPVLNVLVFCYSTSYRGCVDNCEIIMWHILWGQSEEAQLT